MSRVFPFSYTGGRAMWWNWWTDGYKSWK